MLATPETTQISAGWLRYRSFDLQFIAGITVVALLSGLIVVNRPELFKLILFADLWLLGYHHVVSTYTRLAFDQESFQSHKFLIFGLPLLVIGAVFALGYGIGIWVITSIYLYWQWFHYTRQSWGVSQVYRRKSNGLVTDSELSGKLTFYLLPLWGILYRSNQAPETFLTLELKVIPVPDLAVTIVGICAIISVTGWMVSRYLQWKQGRLPLAHSTYMLSHFVIFYVAYIMIDDITYGWLVVNIWHNAQYIVFVWLFNNNRFHEKVDNKAKFLSIISMRKNRWRYVGVCFGLSTIIYISVSSLVASLTAMIIIYQSINFHHYIVDSIIWKVRKPAIQKTLGLTG